MRLVLAVLVSVLTLAGSAIARTGFQGEAVVTALSGAACAANGESVGAVYYTAFLPADVTDNGQDTYLTFYSYRTAFSIRLAKSALDNNSLYSSMYINSYGKHMVGPSGKVVTTTGGTAPKTNSPFLNVRLTLTNWGTNVGCTATLEGAFIRRR